MAFGPLVLRPGRWAARGRSGRRLASRGHQRARSSVLRKRRAPAPRCPGPARERAEPRDRRSFCGPRLVPPSGRSLARPLPLPSADGSAHGNERRAETLVGRGWGQSADTGGPCEGGGRGAQAGRGSTEGVRAALPAASGTAAWTLVRTAGARVPGARTAPRGFPVSLELPESVANLHTASPGGATDATSSGPAGPNSLAERRTSGCVQPSPPPHASVSSWPPRL